MHIQHSVRRTLQDVERSKYDHKEKLGVAKLSKVTRGNLQIRLFKKNKMKHEYNVVEVIPFITKLLESIIVGS